MDNIERKNRIEDKVIVDCYDEYEMAMGWFYYLQDNLSFPFGATLEGDKVRVESFSNSNEDDVSIDDFVAMVSIQKGKHIYDVPLKNIKAINADTNTLNAIEDWRYWCEEF